MLILTVLCALAAILLLLRAIIAMRAGAPPGLTQSDSRSALPLIAAIACIIVSTLSWTAYKQQVIQDYCLTEKQQAMLSEWNYATLPLKTIRQSDALPVTDTGPADTNSLRGRILIFIKPMCKDCAAIHDDLLNIKAEHPDILFVNTQSPTGRQLVQHFLITDVPSAVYVSLDSDENYYRYSLYQTVLTNTNPDGTQHHDVVYDPDPMPQLLQMQTGGW